VRVGIIGNESGLARRLGDAGVAVVAHGVEAVGRDPAGLVHVDRYGDFFAQLEHPRLFLLDLPPGHAIDRTIDEAYVVMEPGDIVLDPSRSYWGDTLRRYRRMRHRSLFYVDLAVLGAIPGSVILAAGDERGVALAMPLLRRLAGPATAIRAGGSGAAHYALQVRAAVATAVRHAVSEGQQLLEAYPNEPAAASTAAQLWPAAPPPEPGAAWILEDAIHLQAAIPLLAQGIMLELGTALDEQRPTDASPRTGGFVHPDDIL